MATYTHINVRDSRDRLIDLLRLGQTYPLGDLALRDEQLTVAFNASAKIPIEDSQKGVVYQLRFKRQPVERDKGSGVKIEAEGTGDTLLLETYKIQDDTEFDIFARKQSSGRETYLVQTATVKVGLDVTLAASIVDASFLDLNLTGPTDARLIAYNASAHVKLEKSQEGVDYQVVSFEAVENEMPPKEIIWSTSPVRGDLHTITLITKAINEDTDFRIRATKTFDPSENRPTQKTLLDVVLPIKVRANPTLAVVVSAPVIDFKQSASITIARTQQNVTYRLYACPIPDRDFDRTAVPESGVVRVGVIGEPDVQIRVPVQGPAWATPEGYVEMGNAIQGTGGDLVLTTNALTDDILVIVQAQKHHDAPQVTSSAVRLAQVAAVLVRPDPAPPLHLAFAMGAAESKGELQVFGGQPGVFYYMQDNSEKKDLGMPAYFHKRDARDRTVNKGMEQLAMEVDFVIARSWPRSGVGAVVDLAQAPPQSPLLETGPLSAGMRLSIRAVKGQTRVATPLTAIVLIPIGPNVMPEKAIVDFGAATRICVKASRTEELYQLLLEGKASGVSVKGTGKDLFLDTGELKTDTTYEILVKQPDQPIPVERVLSLVSIKIRPDPTLSVRAVNETLDLKGETDILIEASQIGVQYQLLVGRDIVGQPIVGHGSTLTLPTGSLAKTTTFLIHATRVAQPDVFADLLQRVTVNVKASAEPG